MPPCRNTIWFIPQSPDSPAYAGSSKWTDKTVCGTEPNHAYHVQKPRPPTTRTAANLAMRPAFCQYLASAKTFCPAKTGISIFCASAFARQNGEQTWPNKPMHCGHIGFPQITQWCTANSRGCFAQCSPAGGESGVVSAGPGCGSPRAILSRGVSVAGCGAAGVGPENSRRINSLTKPDESSPQAGQTKFTG